MPGRVLDTLAWGWSHRAVRSIVFVVSLALAATYLEAIDTKSLLDTAAYATTPAGVQEDFTRPDLVSALLAARLTGQRVEVTGEETESSTTFVNPDATSTTEVTPAPTRVRDGDGWTPVDTDLARSGDTWGPKASPTPVTFSNGGDGPVATAVIKGKTLALNWGTGLPTPTIDGSSATYKIDDNTDLVITALVDGFEQSLMLRGPPTVAPRIHVPWDLTGLDLVADDAGSFSFIDSNGVTVFTSAAPMMYGATIDPDTEAPTQQARVAATVNGDTLDLTPSMHFLTDPATVYPVRIDPTVASVTRLGDTWVQNGVTTSKVSDHELYVGMFGGVASRSYVSFNTSSLAGKHVTAASLKVWNNDANSCTAATMNAYPLSSPGWDATTVWSTKPAANTSATYAGSGSFAHGIDGTCANAYGTLDVTKMVNGWTSGAITNYGMQLSGSETTGAQGWGLCSMNINTVAGQSCNTTDHYSTLSVTYNSYPNAPSSLSASPTVIGPSGKTYGTSYTPTLSAAVGDPDGGVVKLNFELSHDPAYTAEGTGIIWTGTQANVTAGAIGSLQVPTGTLTAYGHEQWRVRGSVATGSGGTDYGPWSAYQFVVINVAAPAAPSISCTSYTANTWTDQAAGGATCTFDTTAADGAGYYWSLDDPDPDTVINDSSLAGAPKTAVIGPGSGQHTLYAQARDSALNMSGVTTYTFGVGTGGILTPEQGARTQNAVTVTSQSRSTSTTVIYKYRVGDVTQSWVTIPNGDLTPPGSSTAISGPITGTVTGSNTNYPALNWNVASSLSNTDGPVDIEACFSTFCSASAQIILSRSAFGESSSTHDLGPGTVSMTTGDFSVAETDAAEGGVSVGRTATSLAPASASTGGLGIFGAGWTASLPGPDAGAGESTLDDQSAKGYVNLVSPDGSSLQYVKDSSGTYIGVGDANDGSSLACAAGGATCTSWQLTDADGTVTTWALTASQWTVATVVETGAESTTSFSRDANGRVTRILAPVPTGVTCVAGIAGLVAGCTADSLTYATATTATGTASAAWGDYTGLAKSISYTAYDPATSAMKTTVIASFLYDNTGHLRASWDPRISPALKTIYDYNTSGQISTQTSPGRAAWTMDYDDTGRLADVSRVDPTNGTATEALVYNVPTTGAGAPIDLSSGVTATWAQTSDLPYAGAAVFPASNVPSRNVHGDYTPVTADWPYADITYLDVAGQAVNTAAYGSGDWQITSTRYNDIGNTTWSLDDGNRAQALTPTASTDPYVAAQSSSAARANLLADTTTYSDDGVDVIGTEGPAHQVQLASGSLASVRVQTVVTYDQGKPTTDEYHLPTTTTTQPAVLDGTATSPADTRTSLTGYDPIDGASATGATSGWTVMTATSSTTVMGVSPGGADIVTKTRFDSSGRVVEARMPASSGTDAGTNITTYYTAAVNAGLPACGLKPQWAGSVCQSAPKTQPPGTTIPISATTYTYYGATDTTIETSGTTTRTTSTTYDSAGRPTGQAVAVVPSADGGTTLPASTIGYSTTTGEQTTVSTSGNTISSTTNNIGEQIQYVANGSTMGTTYDIDGQTATRSDGKATYTFTYDGTDYAGKVEHRGMLTSMFTSITGKPSTFKAAYDAAGNMITEYYPSGFIATSTFDNTEDQRTLTYSKSGTTWLSFDSVADNFGQTVHTDSPQSSQNFSFDHASRLTSVADTNLGQCTTRTYGFSKDSTRTSMKSSSPNGDGSCQVATGTTTTSTFDAADRMTDSGYTYDKFGRTLTAPAADVTGGSALTVGYYTDDLVSSQSQGSTTKTFTLDPAYRLLQATDSTSSTETRRIVNHYDDDGDSPAWISTSTDAGATTTWQRNVEGIDGSLGAVQSSDGSATLQLSNMHGDIVATADDDAAAVGISTYFESTEYGAPRDTNTTSPTRYGWLGAAQRSVDDLAGLTLMGVRLYNPITGRFLSVDPVSGGNVNPYAYPCNPVDGFDLDGRRKESRWNHAKRLVKEAIACGALGLWGCLTAGRMSAIALGVTHWMKDDEANAVRHFMWQAGLDFFFGAAAAKRMGDAHEYGLSKTNEAADSRRDQKNNATSRRWADHHRNAMWVHSFYVVETLMHYLYKKGRQLFKNGTLEQHK